MNYQKIATISVANVLAELDTNKNGLSQAVALERLNKYGKNELKENVLHWYNVLGRQFNSPFTYLLFAAAALALGLKEWSDGVIIFVFIIVNATLGFLEEWHSEQSVKLLKKFVVQKIRVKRGGAESLIPACDLVPGDLVLLEAGDIIPADLRFIESHGILVDESILTGESIAIAKIVETIKLPQALHEALNIGFSGTILTSGSAVGIAFATGGASELGSIAHLTVETHHQSSFEKGIGKFSSFILRMILTILVLVFIANWIIKGGSANIFEMLLFSIALAVSVVPEALPVVTTIALSKGAVRLAKHKVVVKRLSAVEDLGSIEILCSDKTGTITENVMRVTGHFGTNENLYLYAAMAASSPSVKQKQVNNSFDLALFNKINKEEELKLKKFVRLAEFPFDPIRRRNCAVVKQGDKELLIARGALESILPLCSGVRKDEQIAVFNWVAEQGRLGQRVIAIATKEGKFPNLCAGDETNLQFIGLIAFEDPLKTSAASAIERAKRLGVQIKILTGDGPEVAGAVAKAAKLITDASLVITGEELMKLPENERVKATEKFHVFARVSPEQKHAIIKILQTKFEVGFLGEGINDAPALKSSNVGIVVADASDLAREAADIVLLKKSLSVIIDGIEEGREIFSNTIKYIKATLISNFGNFYAIAVASLILPFLPMLPVQILLLNLLSDFPMIAIATDNVDKVDLHSPRRYNVREVVLVAMILGLVSTIFDFIFFALFKNEAPSVLQTNWFIGSVLTELVLIFSIRTRGFFLRARVPAFGLSILSLLGFIGALVLPYVAFTSKIFSFTPPSLKHLLTILTVVAIYFVTTETVKLLYYRHAREL